MWTNSFSARTPTAPFPPPVQPPAENPLPSSVRLELPQCLVRRRRQQHSRSSPTPIPHTTPPPNQSGKPEPITQTFRFPIRNKPSHKRQLDSPPRSTPVPRSQAPPAANTSSSSAVAARKVRPTNGAGHPPKASSLASRAAEGGGGLAAGWRRAGAAAGWGRGWILCFLRCECVSAGGGSGTRVRVRVVGVAGEVRGFVARRRRVVE